MSLRDEIYDILLDILRDARVTRKEYKELFENKILAAIEKVFLEKKDPYSTDHDMESACINSVNQAIDGMKAKVRE